MIGFDKELLAFLPPGSRKQLAELLAVVSETEAFKAVSEKVKEDTGAQGIAILEAGLVMGFFIADEEHRKAAQ